jgi:hypothetical protein
VADFSWSPTDPIISMFVPEMGGGNQPAKVSVALCSWSVLIFLYIKHIEKQIICALSC